MKAGDTYTVAGSASGTSGDSGDVGAATSSLLTYPAVVAFDSQGDVYIADLGNNRVQEMAATTHTQWGISMTAGHIYTGAGSSSGTTGASGDGGPATSALFTYPEDISIGANGLLYIADSYNNVVREVPSATAYSYNEADELTGTTSPTGEVTYAYDGDGLLMGRTSLQGTATYTWDATAGTPALLSDGTNDYLYGPDGMPVEQASLSTDNPQYFVSDDQGSTRALINSSGEVGATYTFDAYGNVISGTGTVTTPLLYDGEYSDQATGFYYLQARWYDPTTDEFMSVDPDVAQTGQPYAYAGDDPVNESDPSGEDCEPSSVSTSSLVGDSSASTMAPRVKTPPTVELKNIGYNYNNSNLNFRVFVNELTNLYRPNSRGWMNVCARGYGCGPSEYPLSTHNYQESYLSNPVYIWGVSSTDVVFVDIEFYNTSNTKLLYEARKQIAVVTI